MKNKRILLALSLILMATPLINTYAMDSEDEFAQCNINIKTNEEINKNIENETNNNILSTLYMIMMMKNIYESSLNEQQTGIRPEILKLLEEPSNDFFLQMIFLYRRMKCDISDMKKKVNSINNPGKILYVKQTEMFSNMNECLYDICKVMARIFEKMPKLIEKYKNEELEINDESLRLEMFREDAFQNLKIRLGKYIKDADNFKDVPLINIYKEILNLFNTYLNILEKPKESFYEVKQYISQLNNNQLNNNNYNNNIIPYPYHQQESEKAVKNIYEKIQNILNYFKNYLAHGKIEINNNINPQNTKHYFKKISEIIESIKAFTKSNRSFSETYKNVISRQLYILICSAIATKNIERNYYMLNKIRQFFEKDKKEKSKELESIKFETEEMLKTNKKNNHELEKINKTILSKYDIHKLPEINIEKLNQINEKLVNQIDEAKRILNEYDCELTKNREIMQYDNK